MSLIFHMVDTETSGLQVHDDAHVVEIALVTYHLNNGVIAQFSSLVQPPVLTDRGLEVVQRYSQIEPAAILAAPPPAAVWSVILAQLSAHPGTVAAWNLPFDRHMIRRTFLGLDDRPSILGKHGVPPETLEHKYGWPEHAPIENDPVPWGHCAMRAFAHQHRLAARGQYGDLYTGEWTPKPWTLSGAARRAGVTFDGQAHRALADATVAAKLYARVLLGVPLLPAGWN